LAVLIYAVFAAAVGDLLRKVHERRSMRAA
jgi:hypothetical protein